MEAVRARVKQLPDKAMSQRDIGEPMERHGRPHHTGVISAVQQQGLVILIDRGPEHGGVIRCRRNDHCAGFGRQKKVNGRWQYTRAESDRDRDTWVSPAS